MTDSATDIEPYEVGRRLKELRKKRGESQEQFAEHLGVVSGTYAKYERGQRQPDAINLLFLRRNINADLNWLIAGDASVEIGINEDFLQLAIEDVMIMVLAAARDGKTFTPGDCAAMAMGLYRTRRKNLVDENKAIPQVEMAKASKG